MSVLEPETEPLPDAEPLAEPLMLPDVLSVVVELVESVVVSCALVALLLVEVSVEEAGGGISVSVLPLRVSLWPQPARPKAAAIIADAAVIFSFFVFIVFLPRLSFFHRPACGLTTLSRPVGDFPLAVRSTVSDERLE